ncbi:MAG: helix-turn-helix domain-containing protein [Verrucomicrobia bacterium]|nr:helix-turn-helix domain-containing protein [Verrucomicrobiota bacterium]
MAHSNLVQSLERGMKIVDLVALSGSGLTLAEIADALDVKRPTAFNLTRTLVAHRYLEKTTRPVRFLLGPGVLEAAEAWRHRATARQFEGLVRFLAAQINATVVLAEPLGGEIVAVHLIETNRPGIVQHSATRRLAPYIHASTLCMLAFWPAAEAGAYESRYPFHEYGAGIWGTEERLRRFLEDARQRGHVAWEAPNSRFLVGVPVYSKEGTLLAAVGVSIAMSRPWSEAEKAGVLRTVVDGVSRLHSGAYTESPATSAARKAPRRA